MEAQRNPTPEVATSRITLANAPSLRTRSAGEAIHSQALCATPGTGSRHPCGARDDEGGRRLDGTHATACTKPPRSPSHDVHPAESPAIRALRLCSGASLPHGSVSKSWSRNVFAGHAVINARGPAKDSSPAAAISCCRRKSAGRQRRQDRPQNAPSAGNNLLQDSITT